MREWWANVYPGRYGQEPYTRLGEKGVSRGEAEQARALGRPAFRIHVRLKPEGAPRQYLCRHDRQWWETMYGFAKENGWRKGDCDCA